MEQNSGTIGLSSIVQKSKRRSQLIDLQNARLPKSLRDVPLPAGSVLSPLAVGTHPNS
jgi:hypothetical protein